MWTAELPRKHQSCSLGAVPSGGVGSLDVAAAFELSLLLVSNYVPVSNLNKN